jgi:hypothetical protein
MVNTSTISIRSNEITVVHEPLPWINRNKTFDARDITQLYSETYEMGKQNNNPVYAFRVMMQLKDGKTTKLLSGLKNAEQALFIEQETEKFLRLKDRSMPNELPRY